MKSLIVDDEIVNRKKLKFFLKAFGECEMVESGKLAIAAYKESLENKEPFDLITLDIVMPEMDGLSTLQGLRKVEKEFWAESDDVIPPVIIVMVTSHSDKGLVIGSAKAGSDGYIVKPYDKDIIIQKLKDLGFEV